MALVQVGGAVLTIAFRDNNGKRSGAQFRLPAAVVTVAEALTRGNAIRDAIAPLVDAEILGATLTFGMTEDASVAALPQSEVERKLVLSLSNGEEGPVRSTVRIPSPIADIEQANTDTVALSNALIVALSTALTNNVVTNRGEALTSVDDAYVQHVSRKRK